jgi:hypothetical protein
MWKWKWKTQKRMKHAILLIGPVSSTVGGKRQGGTASSLVSSHSEYIQAQSIRVLQIHKVIASH